MTTGKWKDPGVPHKGWACVDIKDLGYPDAICEMCEVMEIRYVHSMVHPEFAQELHVGCVCAGNMEEDRLAARLRETAFKASRARRKNWLTRRWFSTWRGADYLNTDGFHVSVWPKGDGTYQAKVTDRQSEVTRYSQRKYFSSDAAKLAAFDAMIAMADRRKC